MSSVFSYDDAMKKIEEVDIDTYVRHLVNESSFSLRELSLLINKDASFINKQLKRKKASLPLLYALSLHLKANMFEPFQNLLPANLQSTQREAALQAEIDNLKTQLADMTKERDIYMSVALKK